MEEILPPQTQSGAGFELTRVRQFTIFLENRVGRLGQLVRTLEESLSKVVALSIEESADNALVRLICSEPGSCPTCGTALMLTCEFRALTPEQLQAEAQRRSSLPASSQR